MNGKLCFFIGHRDAPDSLSDKLAETIERHIVDLGVDSFIVGNYGRFDRMSQSALAPAKKRHAEISVRLAIPYHPSLVRVELPEGFDGSYFPDGQEELPPRAAIPRLNRTLVSEADFLIAYVRYISNGAYNVMEYAKKREKRGLLHITLL